MNNTNLDNYHRYSYLIGKMFISLDSNTAETQNRISLVLNRINMMKRSNPN